MDSVEATKEILLTCEYTLLIILQNYFVFLKLLYKKESR